ncbi:uncharacterized protein [Argopecten irradians]|uniref:uncharacterized protein n=1 Tax=Argopecten irradians TaxID=31199 RepID=UPI00371E1E9F
MYSLPDTCYDRESSERSLQLKSINRNRWGLTETSYCPLCNKPGSLAHVLTGCNVAITQGRYGWRHDKVLRELADIPERTKKRKPAKGCTFINFVQGGEGGHTFSTVHQWGILDGAQNWEMRVDLDRRLVFPDIIQTNLRPDILICSTQGKKMVMVKLTVPWEESCEETFEIKRRSMKNWQETSGP